MVVPVVLGIFIDVYLRTMPWAIVIGAIAGFGLGMYHLIVLVNQHDREKPDPSKKEQESQ